MNHLLTNKNENEISLQVVHGWFESFECFKLASKVQRQKNIGAWRKSLEYNLFTISTSKHDTL